MSDDSSMVSRRSFLTAFVTLLTGATVATLDAKALGSLLDYGQASKAADAPVTAVAVNEISKATQQETLEFIASLERQLKAMALEAGEHELARHLEQASDEALSSLVALKRGTLRERERVSENRKVPKRTHTA